MESVRDWLAVSSGYGHGYGSGWRVGGGGGKSWGGDYGYEDRVYADHGYGDGDGHNIKSYNGRAVYEIDGVQTLIDEIRHGFGVGSILNSDLTLTPCYVVKANNLFAHGETPCKAMEALRDKLLDGMTEDERIAAFWECHNREEKYNGRDLWHWHHRLTGSCEMGRNQLAADRGIDIDNSEWTVAEFVALCRDSYGGSVIRRLEEG